jgi:methyltransferase (TIGR00027 family)
MTNLIQNVSDTAFWVAHYRAQETLRPDALFRDPLAQPLVGDLGRRISDAMGPMSRYTEWSVVARTLIIDQHIEKLVGEGVDAVINLGAGLDTRPYRMNLPRDLHWIEVDQASIIAHKTQVLRSESPKCHLTRFEVDLANASARRSFLAQVAPRSRKALILTEGVIPYLSPEQVSDLAADLKAQSRFAYWIAEYLDPKVYPYLQTPARAAQMKNAPFRFFPADWFGFFRKAGWVERETRFTGEIAHEFGRKPPMPPWMALFFRFMPESVKRKSRRMNGYVIFERDDG